MDSDEEQESERRVLGGYRPHPVTNKIPWQRNEITSQERAFIVRSVLKVKEQGHKHHYAITAKAYNEKFGKKRTSGDMKTCFLNHHDKVVKEQREEEKKAKRMRAPAPKIIPVPDNLFPED